MSRLRKFKWEKKNYCCINFIEYFIVYVPDSLLPISKLFYLCMISFSTNLNIDTATYNSNI